MGSSGSGNAGLLRAMQKWQLRGELFHLSSVPPSEMRLLYAAADPVVCPSVSEGFDLPSIEAMRCGAAVAASDIPVHREILGDAALYFDPYSTTGICDALMACLRPRTGARTCGPAACSKPPSSTSPRSAGNGNTCSSIAVGASSGGVHAI